MQLIQSSGCSVNAASAENLDRLVLFNSLSTKKTQN